MSRPPEKRERRVHIVLKLKPETLAYIQSEMKRTGETLHEAVDRLIGYVASKDKIK